MKLAIYYPWIYLTSGAERTILEIARRSRHQVTVFTNEYQPHATFPELGEVDIRVLSRVSVRRSVGAVARSAATILAQKIDFSGFDALLVVCEGLGDLVVLRHRDIPAYCLCLTPLRIVYDHMYRASYLANRPLPQRTAIEAASLLYRAVDRVAWRRYQRVFPISREVQRRIIAGGLAPESRLEVLHPGIDPAAYRPSPPAERTFLVPGRIMWTKNLALAIDGFRLFRKSMPDAHQWRLRFCGIVDRKSEPYLERLRRQAAGDSAIEFLIHPSDEAMRAQYERCFATLFTAFNEDWGLVIIEAMASGKPSVAVNRGGPVEIIRDGRDGLLTEPNPEAFAAAMRRLACEAGLRERLATEAPVSARRFGWDPFVARLDDAVAMHLDVTTIRRTEPEWQETGV